MSVVAIVGAQWGDEGKGKIVDIYTEFAEVVVRSAGGPNAGHTLVVGDDKLVVRLLPSGILRPSTLCVLGQGMVVDPDVLLGEIDELSRRGHKDLGTRLALSDRAHLILPYHVLVDTLRETSARRRARSAPDSSSRPRKASVLPYEDKCRRPATACAPARSGVSPSACADRVEAALAGWAPMIQGALVARCRVRRDLVAAALMATAGRLLPLLRGHRRRRSTRALKAGKRMRMLEG